MFGIGPWELVLILIIALIIFGPGKLPEIGQALGKGVKEFRRATGQSSADENTGRKESAPQTTGHNELSS